VIEVLERGDITFFIRPRVQDADAPVGLAAIQGDPIQRFFAVLGTGDHHRRLRIGRKHLPSRKGQRFWAQVERVGPLERVVGDLLEAETYTTRTRGERYQPAARPVAAGEYALVRHGDHSHLVYRVDEGSDHDVLTGDVLVEPRGSFVLLFKNRRGRARWTTEGDAPDLMDVEDAEVVLVAASAEAEGEADVANIFLDPPVSPEAP
jgi:hypothetical protein